MNHINVELQKLNTGHHYILWGCAAFLFPAHARRRDLIGFPQKPDEMEKRWDNWPHVQVRWEKVKYLAQGHTTRQ